MKSTNVVSAVFGVALSFPAISSDVNSAATVVREVEVGRIVNVAVGDAPVAEVRILAGEYGFDSEATHVESGEIVNRALGAGAQACVEIDDVVLIGCK